MQLKTAVLSTAIVGAIAVLATASLSSSGSTTFAATPAIAPAAAVTTTHAAAVAAARLATPHAAQAPSQFAVGARSGSDLLAASTSPEQAAASPAAQRARGLLETVAADEVHRAKADGFVARDVMIDRDGTEHVRMERTYRGLPVVGGDLVVHSRNGELKSITQGDNMRSFGRPAIEPKISAEHAKVEAGAAFDGTVTAMTPAALVIFARGTEPTLAYQVDVTGDRRNDPAPGLISYYLDAATGKLLQEDDRVHSAAANGTGRTLTLGNVGLVSNSVSGGYTLTDPTRGNGQTLDARNQSGTSGAVAFNDSDNVWGNNTTSDRASAAADAHYGVAATFDYFKNVHGRSGIFNDGRGVKSYVHYGPTNLVNAYWTGSAMVYGDGDGVTYRPLVALDVAGHEMAHGVTGATARLGYYNIKDSGGLNEATSDIFGTLVEFSVGNANDPGDYLLGEEVYINNPGDTKALRLMFKQDADGRSFSCYPVGGFTASQTGQNGKYDPHLSSGVGNRFFYLLAEGAVKPAGFNYTPSQLVCNGDTAIAGIGRAKAGAIWYRALTRYFVSSTTYPQARTATLQAATDLYGGTSNEYKAVARAWSAVSVN
ncbi:M4 family metallopeptidase [Lysobacter antibioticus]|uniref:Neutral metalloproteinase n=1 Tax=Lysobacter antibioticus TaxID=84531 RepID=A0A0S2FE86_LYSAN|nr:M4 family metallopeptidase [Lysobacter antibioticus]ALN81842.1 thermolysin domain protein [Lysobacter antibioticus]